MTGAVTVLLVGLAVAVGSGLVLYGLIRQEHDRRTVTDRDTAERMARRDTAGRDAAGRTAGRDTDRE